MKAIQLAAILFFVLFIGCGRGQYEVVEVNNPVYKPNTVFISSEDLSSKKFSHLIERYQLDTIFHGETDEFKRIILLRHCREKVFIVGISPGCKMVY